ncbi:MAG: hypothetical protein IPH12_11955 [Saprospirales bacterium]|nr:hypothetical protein [Saprospirales bacterium]MBK8921083.1 hypothetical protein [Saprospirales bacterium]
MDYSEKTAENYQVSRESDFAYARWYANQPDTLKAEFLADGFQFAFEKIAYDEKKVNPFVSEAEITARFIELINKQDYTPETLAFIREKMAERSEQEWKQRFKTMKKQLGWTYDDMARFIGASSGASVKASVNRQLPAFAKLAVCVFEQLTKNER